jgi:hypothetical protein
MALLQGVTNWLFRPQQTADGSVTPNAQRMAKYNEMAVVDYYRDQYPVALEGSYFVATNPTPGTGIAITTSLTNYASGGTKPFLVVMNNNPAGGPNLELDYIKIIQTAGQLPTTTTNVQLAVVLDTVANKSPTTAGTAIVPVNVNPASGIVSNAAVQAGAITTTADSPAARLVFHSYIEPIVSTTPCAVAGDTFIAKFGGNEHNLGNNGYMQPNSGGTPTSVKVISDQGPPIVVAPGWAACFKIFGTGNGAAATYEFELGYRER